MDLLQQQKNHIRKLEAQLAAVTAERNELLAATDEASALLLKVYGKLSHPDFDGRLDFDTINQLHGAMAALMRE